MTVVMTMMVRDEADIIAATIEHHLAQGVDHILVTDNASVDGTREILDAYAEVAPVTVLHDAEHRKQQARVVTAMARRAHDDLGADWVVNGDADEFVRPLDASSTLREIFERMPVSIRAFEAPVVNLVGPMAQRGSGIRRLVHRDQRSASQLQDAGLIAHPTPNAIHVGASDVDVGQGNHTTSIEQRGEVPPGMGVEVLHLPWRSVAQLRRKTEHMGRGYDASPELNPSPNHHGMRDWRRLRGGVLEPFLALRSPTREELECDAFPSDTTLREALERLVDDAVLPEQLRRCLDDSDDQPVDDDEVRVLRERARRVSRFEEVLYEDIVAWRLESEALRQDRDGLAFAYSEAIALLEAERGASASALAALEAERAVSADATALLEAERITTAQALASSRTATNEALDRAEQAGADAIELEAELLRLQGSRAVALQRRFDEAARRLRQW